MLVCGHDKEKYGDRLCTHLYGKKDIAVEYVKWFIGKGLEAELLCKTCADDRKKGESIQTDEVCQECYECLVEDEGDLFEFAGAPEIYTREETFSTDLQETILPKEMGNIINLAPACQGQQAVYYLLAQSGEIFRFDGLNSDFESVAKISIPKEDDHEAWMGHQLRQQLTVSADNRFAAVVNDYGQYGVLVDLKKGKEVCSFDGGDYHPETVPFSFSFAHLEGRTVAIHRSSWNRLDIIDPSTGECLSQRSPTSYSRGEERPEHYLDYFHGALYVSPNGQFILDDGWVWHPVGIVKMWSIQRWLTENVWESEDGPSYTGIALRDYYWDHGITWIDNNRFAIEGIGDDDIAMIEGARIFEFSSQKGVIQLKEINQFAGPGGNYFSNGINLFSSNAQGLSRWDIHDGHRTGHIKNFTPSHHHGWANELIELREGVLLRWHCE